jgi:hypothetical protein
MRQRIVLLSAAVIALVALTLVLWVSDIFSPSIPVSDIDPVNAHYLNGNNGTGGIFLISATPSYGTYPYGDTEGYGEKPDVHRGDPCFIVNVIVRNDYSPQNPLRLEGFGDWAAKGQAFVALSAKLYDINGNRIEATNVTPPYPNPNGPQFDAPVMLLDTGEVVSVSLYFETARHDVKAFTVYIASLSSVPPP